MLWGKAGQRCALCKRELVVSRTPHDRESVVGDEAHIVSAASGGPRFRPLDGDPDSYENHILLCKVDHKLVDDQPGEYTEERLLGIKKAHEQWVAERLDGPGVIPPVRLAYASAGPTPLRQLQSGADVWDVIERAGSYLFPALDEGEGFSGDECDLGDAFFDEARDYAEISGEIGDYGLAHVRTAKRALGEHISALHDCGLTIFGGRRLVKITGGIGPSSHWWEAVLIIRRQEPSSNASDTVLSLVHMRGSDYFQVVTPARWESQAGAKSGDSRSQPRDNNEMEDHGIA